MEPNIITLTDQYGESVRFELLDIVEYEDQEFAVLYPADGGDDEPVHILRITSENLFYINISNNYCYYLWKGGSLWPL